MFRPTMATIRFLSERFICSKSVHMKHQLDIRVHSCVIDCNYPTY